jgi:hypothetical protein
LFDYLHFLLVSVLTRRALRGRQCTVLVVGLFVVGCGVELSSLSVNTRGFRALPAVILNRYAVQTTPHQNWGRAGAAGSRFARDDKEPGPSWGKQLPGERPRGSSQENRRFSRFPPTWPLVPLPHAPRPLFLVSGAAGGIAPSIAFRVFSIQ